MNGGDKVDNSVKDNFWLQSISEGIIYMSKYKVLLYFCFIFLVCLTSCFSREITVQGDGNPHLRKYVTGTITDLSRKDDEYLYPKFEIEITKVTKYRIEEYEVLYVFLFGQDANVLLSERKLFNENDSEIQELNRNGSFTISCELDKVPLESIIDPSSYMGILNYTSIEVQNCKVKINTSVGALSD